ncbi:MAG: M61 family metallopeptidase [Bacteroidota bacterium]|nr:M61 family metallopeptidase [Bacteroidota bacterium]
MKKRVLFSLLLISTFYLDAQKVSYRVSFPNAVHHEARIALTVTGISSAPAIFEMSRSSPGRYATHEFGKNVYQVSASDASGAPLTLKKVSGDRYEVPKHGSAITITYTLFGNYADGTYVGIDPESIHLNMPGAFMWMKGMDEAPIEISFDPPGENKGIIATQLVPTNDPHRFTAPGLQYFMDSPTKIGDLAFRSWQIHNPDGKAFTMRIALEADASKEQFDELETAVRKIVSEAQAVYGEFPNYDHGMYTFIASANPYVHGDGMEHRNSTMITQTMFSFSARNLLEVFAHEYFHNWNVERIRPKTLEPFQFDKANMSNELWFAEGFTQYYGNLLLARSGLSAESNYIYGLAYLINAKENTPGAQLYSPVQASNHAVFVDAGVSIDKTNYPNMFTSYYTYGAAIALALDIEMQTRFHKTLDAYMKAMWQRFGKTEIPYTLASMQDALASVTDNQFAADFFQKYILGHSAIDYGHLMSQAGYDLENSSAGKPYLGMNTGVNRMNHLVILSNTLIGSPAYQAGLDVDDEILKMDDTPVKSSADINEYLKDKKPGATIEISFRHRDTEKKTKLNIGEKNTPVLVPFEKEGKTLSAERKRIRDSWFQSNTH